VILFAGNMSYTETKDGKMFAVYDFGHALRESSIKRLTKNIQVWKWATKRNPDCQEVVDELEAKLLTLKGGDRDV